MGEQGRPQGGKLLVGLEPAKALGRFQHGGAGPAQGHGGVLPPLHVSADLTNGAVHVLDDVGAGQRPAQFGRQAEPGDREDFVDALQDACRHAGGSRRRARLRISFSALSASSISHAWRSALRTLACRGLARRSTMLRALCTWQRWIGVWRPKVLRIALDSALAPSMMNRRQTLGSRPRPTRLSSRAWATAAFSLAPSITPSGCLVPAPSIPMAASSIRSSSMWMPSIWMISRSSLDNSAAIHSFIRSADRATNRRETADLDTPAPLGEGTSPPGRRTARPSLRVDTLISIRLSAHCPSRSSDRAACQLGRLSSPPSRPRTRGRLISTLPPWKPTFPLVLPQR